MPVADTISSETKYTVRSRRVSLILGWFEIVLGLYMLAFAVAQLILGNPRLFVQVIPGPVICLPTGVFLLRSRPVNRLGKAQDGGRPIEP